MNFYSTSTIEAILKLQKLLYSLLNVTLSAKTRIDHTSMHIEKNRNLIKIICEITHATGKYLQGLMGPAISEGSSKSTKTIHYLTRLAMESSKIVFFSVSVA